jgi:hypothetical protein
MSCCVMYDVYMMTSKVPTYTSDEHVVFTLHLSVNELDTLRSALAAADFSDLQPVAVGSHDDVACCKRIVDAIDSAEVF